MPESTDLFADIPKKLFFRADEVAEICSVDVRTVYNWHSEGRINGTKLPTGSLRFSRLSVVQFLKTTT
jgi:predicted site-specific integrase-resolvase